MIEISTEMFKEYAPWLVLTLCFLFKNKIFVTPGELAKESKAIMENVEARFLTIMAFNQFEKRTEENFKNIHKALEDGGHRFDKVDDGIAHIVDIIMESKEKGGKSAKR